jgi:hypothetical protein
MPGTDQSASPGSFTGAAGRRHLRERVVCVTAAWQSLSGWILDFYRKSEWNLWVPSCVTEKTGFRYHISQLNLLLTTFPLDEVVYSGPEDRSHEPVSTVALCHAVHENTSLRCQHERGFKDKGRNFVFSWLRLKN